VSAGTGMRAIMARQSAFYAAHSGDRLLDG
jgi:hypothetical protein